MRKYISNKCPRCGMEIRQITCKIKLSKKGYQLILYCINCYGVEVIYIS